MEKKTLISSYLFCFACFFFHFMSIFIKIPYIFQFNPIYWVGLIFHHLVGDSVNYAPKERIWRSEKA